MDSNFIWNADNGDGTYTNPVLYADYSDPDAIRVGEDYYMIASSFCNAPGLPVLHSRDLVNWKVINYVLDEIPEERYSNPIHGCGVWAPSLRYHNGTYYACFPMPDEGIYMSTTTDPYGKWSKPVNIRPGAGWIDPCPFFDEDGRAYLVAGVAKSRIGYKSVLHMVEMRPDGMGLIGEERVVFDGNLNDQVTIEGPKLYKRNGWYYIFAPAGGVKTGWQTVLRSRDIFGPYEYKVVLRQEDTVVNGPHQGAWVDTVTGEDWFLHFQDVYAAGRIIHLQPMIWREDWPVIGEPVFGTDYGKPVITYKKPDIGKGKSKKCEPATSDNFSEEELSLQWQWNANYKKEWFSLDGRYLKLSAVKTDPMTACADIPNILLQKWPAPEFKCVTGIKLDALKPGDTVGVISLGMQYGALEFRKENNKIEAYYVQGSQKFGKILCEETAQQHQFIESWRNLSAVYVKYIVRCTGRRDLNEREKNFPLETVTIEYSVDGLTYKKAFSMDAIPGRWVGVKNGVYCIRRCEGKGGEAGVISVNYSR